MSIFKFTYRLFNFVLFLVIGTVFVNAIASMIWLKSVTKEVTPEELRPAQVGVVFMGDFDSDFSALGRQTIRRLNHAMKLYRDGTIRYFVCVGGARPQINKYGSRLMRRYLMDRDVPFYKIFLDEVSYDSRTNWVEAKRILSENGFHSALFISSPLHVYRLRSVVEENPAEPELDFQWAPFAYKSADPPIGLIETWQRVNYEWLSWISGRLPEPVYELIIHHFRHQPNAGILKVPEVYQPKFG